MISDLTIPEQYRDSLRVGTCSWKYDSWKDLIYDPETRYHPHDYLVDYSRHLSTVEVDQWFWSLFPGEIVMPDKEIVSTYAVSVPDTFSFTIKAPNAITLTHFYARQPARYAGFANRPNEHFLSIGLVDKFLSTLESLGPRLGPIMFQFEYLNASKIPSRDAFFEQLDRFLGELPEGFKFAVEIRNPNFLVDAFFDLLRSHRVGTVLLDGYFMPPLSKLKQFDTRTADFSIIRLHGPDRSGIEKETGKVWNQIVQPKSQGIETAIEFVNENSANFVKTYVNVNNHYEGSAPLTIEKMLNELRKERAA